MGSAGRKVGRGALLTVSFYFLYPDALTSGGFYMQTNQPESRLPSAFFLSSYVLGHNPPVPITKYQKTRDSPYTLGLSFGYLSTAGEGKQLISASIGTKLMRDLWFSDQPSG